MVYGTAKKKLEAVLREDFSPREFHVGRVDIRNHLSAPSWQSYNLNIWTGTTASIFSKDPEQKKMASILNRNNISVSYNKDTVSIECYCQGKLFYTIDVSSLLEDVNLSHTIIEAKLGYSLKQIALVIINKGYSGYLPSFLDASDMNPDGYDTCDKEYVDRVEETPYLCQRPISHKGHHLSIEDEEERRISVYNFSKSGARGEWNWMFGVPEYCFHCEILLEGTGYNFDAACSLCSFWLESKATQDENTFIVEGRQYRPGKGGFGGHKWNVQTNDGRSWVGELFTQGEVPQHLRYLFPDNAKFLR